MGDISSGCTIDAYNLGSKRIIWIETATTADSDDTIALDLTDYGAKTIEGITGYVHTTTDSVVAAEAPTTSVSGTTLTITLGGSSQDDKKRQYKLECDC